MKINSIMETAMIIRGEKFHIKYEKGIVSFRPSDKIGWVSCQKEPINGLNEEEVIEVARQCIKGLGQA
jgi:hypothetical protein